MAATEWVLGWFYIVLGVSVFLQTKLWIEYARVLYSQPYMMLAQGFITLLLGLVIIVLHPQWVMAPSVITTVIGWLACIKGVMLLCFPRAMIRFFPLRLFGDKFLRVESIIIIVLGAVIVYFSNFIPL